MVPNDERELLGEGADTDLQTDIDDSTLGNLSNRSIDIDDIFDVLGRPANRYVLTYLLQSDEPVYSHELVEYIIAETEPPEEISEQEYRGQINSQLLHASLPKLEDAGLIDFNKRRQRIEETESTALTLPYLRIALLQQQSND